VRFRGGAADLRLQLMPSSTPIQPVLAGSPGAALAASAALFEAGLWVTAIRPPTVREARLRVTLSAAHEPADVDRLLEALDRLPGLKAAA
jgi:8-amino-7-oxononanoate synthase